MKSHFIEGTNEQYSIREDGKLIKHFKITKLTKNIKDVILIQKKHTVRIKGDNLRLTSSTLLLKHFNYLLCKKCNNKIYNPSSAKVNCCEVCNKKRRLRSTYEWKKNNPLLVKKWSKIESDNHINKITKQYISRLFNISIKDLSDDIYLAKRQQILLHRELKKIKDENTK